VEEEEKAEEEDVVDTRIPSSTPMRRCENRTGAADSLRMILFDFAAAVRDEQMSFQGDNLDLYVDKLPGRKLDLNASDVPNAYKGKSNLVELHAWMYTAVCLEIDNHMNIADALDSI